MTVSVTDNLGGTGSNTFAANVSAVSPIVVTSPGTQSATAATSHTFNLGSFSDPNAASSWTETINWGDSTSSTLTLPPGSLGTLKHTYATASSYTVTVSVSDNLGGTGSNTFTANVSAKVLPIAVKSPGSQSSSTGSSHSFSLGSFTDPNAASSWTETINWGDKSTYSNLNLPPGSLGTLKHTYNKAGTYTVTVTVIDNLGGTGSNTFTVKVSGKSNGNAIIGGMSATAPISSTSLGVASVTNTTSASLVAVAPSEGSGTSTASTSSGVSTSAPTASTPVQVFDLALSQVTAKKKNQWEA